MKTGGKKLDFPICLYFKEKLFTNNLTPDDVPILMCHSNKMFNFLTYGPQLDLVAAYQWMVIALLFLLHLIKTHTKMVYALQNQHVEDI